VSSFAWGVIGILGGLLVMALGDLVSEEVRGWLDLLPCGILRLAARRLDPETREAIYEEDWLPELIYALRGAESRPITRVVKGVCFATGLFISARRVEAIPRAVNTTASTAVSAGVASATAEAFASVLTVIEVKDSDTARARDAVSKLRDRIGSRAFPGQLLPGDTKQQPDVLIWTSHPGAPH
jgi:hypothetical protein